MTGWRYDAPIEALITFEGAAAKASGTPLASLRSPFYPTSMLMRSAPMTIAPS
jgi:hypothetical protein